MTGIRRGEALELGRPGEGNMMGVPHCVYNINASRFIDMCWYTVDHQDTVSLAGSNLFNQLIFWNKAILGIV